MPSLEERWAKYRSTQAQSGYDYMPGDEHIFADAWNMALEEAAKACEQKVERDAEYGGRFGGYGNFMGDKTGPECATAVRALKSPLQQGPSGK